MLKSEALGQLSAIADDDNRDFEDFAAAYKTMEEVVKEYPELSHYVLPIVVQTAADKGFNADIRPAAARVFNAAALNLPAEDVVKNVVRAFKRCPSFAYYLMPDLLSGRPELSAALFPEAEAGLAKLRQIVFIRRLRRQKPRFCALRTGKRRQCSILLSVRQRKKKIFPASSIARWGRFIHATRR